jgi:predicted  nucleic acid-binding Zn-ribbon protein
MALFGFLGKHEKPAQAQASEVSLAELPEWFEKAMGGEIREGIGESEKRYGRILERLEGIRGSLDRLEHARMPGDERYHVAANMIKESFVRKNRGLLKNLDSFLQGYRPDYEYFMSFQKRGMESIRELKDSTPKQTILLSRYFKRESGGFVESVKQAEDELQAFMEFLRAGSGALATRENIKGMVRSCHELQGEIDRLDSRASELREHARVSRERKAELEREYLGLLKSREWGELNALNREVAGVRNDLRDAELKIGTELSSMKRPLKKLEHGLAKAGRLKPMQRNTLHDFIRDPLKAVMSERGEKDLQKVLNQLRRHADGMKVGLKDKEQVKVDELIRRLGEDIPGLKSRYLELRERLEGMEKRLGELSGLSRSKEDMEAGIGRAGGDAARLDDELKGISSRRSGIRGQLDEKIGDVEAVILEETGRRVRIKP